MTTTAAPTRQPEVDYSEYELPYRVNLLHRLTKPWFALWLTWGKFLHMVCVTDAQHERNAKAVGVDPDYFDTTFGEAIGTNINLHGHKNVGLWMFVPPVAFVLTIVMGYVAVDVLLGDEGLLVIEDPNVETAGEFFASIFKSIGILVIFAATLIIPVIFLVWAFMPVFHALFFLPRALSTTTLKKNLFRFHRTEELWKLINAISGKKVPPIQVAVYRDIEYDDEALEAIHTCPEFLSGKIDYDMLAHQIRSLDFLDKVIIYADVAENGDGGTNLVIAYAVTKKKPGGFLNFFRNGASFLTGDGLMVDQLNRCLRGYITMGRKQPMELVEDHAFTFTRIPDVHDTKEYVI